ncbi:MAG: glycosyltransferase family 2 protein, partial [Deltaproteobacteria bacterium]
MELISIIIPAYNEEEIIGEVVGGIKKIMEGDYEILVVDDGSVDRTEEVAEKAGARVIKHPYNIGNGAAVKTGIRAAKGEILVTMDGDGQHSPEDIPKLLQDIGKYDMVVGARSKDSETKVHRNFANKIYNLFATYVAGGKIHDLTSGFRAVKTHIAKRFVYLLPNTFSYPSTITLSLIRAGYSVKYEPIRVRSRTGKSKIRLFSDGLRFFLIMFKIATLFSPMKIFLPSSLSLIFLGIGYYFYTFINFNRFTNMSLLLIVS